MSTTVHISVSLLTLVRQLELPEEPLRLLLLVRLPVFVRVIEAGQALVARVDLLLARVAGDVLN